MDVADPRRVHTMLSRPPARSRPASPPGRNQVPWSSVAARSLTCAVTDYGLRRAQGLVPKRGGVDARKLVEVLETAVAGGTSQLFLLHDHLDAAGTIRARADSIEASARKDLAAAQELGRDTGVATPLADVVLPGMGAVLEGDYDSGLTARSV